MNFFQLFKLNQHLINVAGYFRYIQCFFLDHRRFSVVKRNRVLVKKENNNKTCYVCALGPSLKNVDLTKIKGDTIVVNLFNKIGESYPDFVPNYYVIVDAGFIKPTLWPSFKESFDAYIDRGCKYIIHSGCEKFISSQYGKDNDSIYYVSQFKGRFTHKRDLVINHIMPSLGNVASTAIGCAIAMGYKKIVLLGCDFNSFAAPVATHCYDEKDISRKISLGFELFSYSFIAKMHEELALYAKMHNVEIVNSTKGSLIDAYPISIEESLYKE